MEWAVPEDAFGVSIPAEVYGNYSGKIKLSDGSYTIKLTSDWKHITFIKNGPSRPATPVLPESAVSNKIVIPSITGATIYYTESATGDPTTDTWTPYPASGDIALTNGYTTIRAAAYKEGLWSEVTAAKTYKYTLPVVNISIDLHTGMATLTPTQALLPAGANAVILYSCGPDAPSKVYTPGTPVNMEAECTVEGKTRYPIKAIVRAWGGGADHSEAVADQSVDSDVRNDQWIGPADVRRVCLWGYTSAGAAKRLAEFSKQPDGSYKVSYSPVSGTDSSDKSQRYFIRVVMNHDDPNNDNADTGGTYYALGTAANGVVSVASGTAYTDIHSFVPSSSDARACCLTV